MHTTDLGFGQMQLKKCWAGHFPLLLGFVILSDETTSENPCSKKGMFERFVHVLWMSVAPNLNERRWPPLHHISSCYLKKKHNINLNEASRYVFIQIILNQTCGSEFEDARCFLLYCPLIFIRFTRNLHQMPVCSSTTALHEFLVPRHPATNSGCILSAARYRTASFARPVRSSGN